MTSSASEWSAASKPGDPFEGLVVRAPAPGPTVAALGGGHGLAASLRALRAVTGSLTAIVGVSDNGGSSGRLRGELGVLPPGDLRMALAALCGDDAWGQTWSRVIQHRFSAEGDLHGHAVGNLLIAALWEETDDIVAGLDWMAALLGAHGRVLPVATVPLEIVADVAGLDPHDPGAVHEVRGQVQVATTPGRVVSLRVDPVDPPACTEAVDAIYGAEFIVLGPGSWYTSVLPHLRVPDVAQAVRTSSATRVLVLNLTAQPGETSGFRPETHLEVLQDQCPGLTLDVVIADPRFVSDVASLRTAAQALGGEVVFEPVGDLDQRVHDSKQLGTALASVLGRGRIAPWR